MPRVTCWHCGKKGHKRDECRSLAADKNKSSSKDNSSENSSGSSNKKGSSLSSSNNSNPPPYLSGAGTASSSKKPRVNVVIDDDNIKGAWSVLATMDQSFANDFDEDDDLLKNESVTGKNISDVI